MSRRLKGVPKGLELVGGIRIIDRVVSALRPVSRELLVAANDPVAAEWLPGVAIVPDAFLGAGGLSGVHAALLRGKDILVVAWDMPFIQSALLRALLDLARKHEADAVVPESDSPFGVEPFCAFYAARVLDRLTSFLNAGGGAAHDFLEQLPSTHRLPAADVRRIGDPRRLLFSVNTRDDLAHARAMAESAQ